MLFASWISKALSSLLSSWCCFRSVCCCFLVRVPWSKRPGLPSGLVQHSHDKKSRGTSTSSYACTACRTSARSDLPLCAHPHSRSRCSEFGEQRSRVELQIETEGNHQSHFSDSQALRNHLHAVIYLKLTCATSRSPPLRLSPPSRTRYRTRARSYEIQGGG